MPVIIGVTNRKGGVGKTTIACALARAYAVGEPGVLLVDCDGDQRDAFWLSTGCDEPQSGAVVRSPLGYDVVWVTDTSDLPQEWVRWSIVIMDGRPSTEAAHALLQEAQLLVVPVLPRDVRGRAAERRMRSLAREYHVPILVIMNRCNDSTEVGVPESHVTEGWLPPECGDLLLELVVDALRGGATWE